MLKFIDKYFWWSLLSIIVLIVTMSLFLGNYSELYDWFYKNAYTDNTNLVTISTVFIGIYFSLYGFLLSSDKNSLISKLKLKEYKRLVSIVIKDFYLVLLSLYLLFLMKISIIGWVKFIYYSCFLFFSYLLVLQFK